MFFIFLFYQRFYFFRNLMILVSDCKGSRAEAEKTSALPKPKRGLRHTDLITLTIEVYQQFVDVLDAGDSVRLARVIHG